MDFTEMEWGARTKKKYFYTPPLQFDIMTTKKRKYWQDVTNKINNK